MPAATSVPLKLSESLIENLLLCDPVTYRGREKLNALGLLGKLGPKEFFHPDFGLWAKPIDQMHLEELCLIDTTDPTPYQPEKIEFERIQKRREDFDAYFEGLPGSHFAAVMGVVGSGKSIAIQREVFENTGKKYLPYRHDEYDGDPEKSIPATPNAILIDFEAGKEAVTFGDSYKCPDHDSPLWLFCTALLDTLMHYIRYLYREHASNLANSINTIEANFINKKEQIFAIEDRFLNLFRCISQWATEKENAENALTIKNVFSEILALLESRPTEFASDRHVSLAAAKKDSRLLIQLLYLISFSAFPNEPKIIIIDNIEDYVAVGRASRKSQADVIFEKDSKLVAISNQQVKELYDALRDAKTTIQDSYINEGITRLNRGINPSVSIIMAMRRTTFELLDACFAGTLKSRFNDLFDITGDTDLVDIWDRKKRFLWDGAGAPSTPALKDNCDSSIRDYIAFADFIMRDANHFNSLQQRMSRILAHGLRRVGHNESRIIYEAYKLLQVHPGEKEEDRKYITLAQYKNIKDKIDASRFMFRRAFIEYYYQLQLLETKTRNEVGLRWRNLNLGHLDGKRTKTYYGRNGKPKDSGELIEYNKIVYADSDSRRNPQWRTLLHRILCILEKHPAAPVSLCVTPTYDTISLYQLMKDLFGSLWKTNPDGNDFGRLAEVLLAASKPEREGDYAPLILMRIDPSPDGVYYSRAGNLAKMLQIIWDADSVASEGDGPYNPLCYGVRLSEAGKEFLHGLQPSFSFFSALYCCNTPPLYFVRSKDLIIHILNKVYDYANKVREAYTKEAGQYLIRINKDSEKEIKDTNQLVKKERQLDGRNDNEYWTFRKQIKNLHTDYIQLYITYIENCYDKLGISEEDKDEIVSAARDVKGRYNRPEWKEPKEAVTQAEKEAAIACF